MALPRVTSPHALGSNRTQRVMLLVIAACLPGALCLTYFFGLGTLLNLIWAGLLALGFEALVLKLRQRPVGFFLRDGSALLTGVLLALALPPYVPWWLTVVAVGFAIIFGKQLYGGLGQNPFNPAMLGYVVVLISFPVAMTTWPAPHTVSALDALKHFFAGVPLADGWSQATALDSLKLNKSLTQSELWASNPAFGTVGGAAVEWVNLAFLAGGLFLLQKNIIRWQAPAAMLATLTLISLIFWNGDSSDSNGSPLFHLFSGATMLGAFFIVTDPVSGATSNRGRLIFGAGVGLLTYIIRTWGGYPDGVAFAVLLMNLAAPTIDYYSRPRTYGHRKSENGFKVGD